MTRITNRGLRINLVIEHKKLGTRGQIVQLHRKDRMARVFYAEPAKASMTPFADLVKYWTVADDQTLYPEGD